jgi:hypothetical protein
VELARALKRRQVQEKRSDDDGDGLESILGIGLGRNLRINPKKRWILIY